VRQNLGANQVNMGLKTHEISHFGKWEKSHPVKDDVKNGYRNHSSLENTSTSFVPVVDAIDP
jgi:hypothetical protein